MLVDSTDLEIFKDAAKLHIVAPNSTNESVSTGSMLSHY
jgi:hypothetical protein